MLWLQVSSNHDDWVSSVAVLGDLVLTGCYDNTVNIWSVAGTKTLVIPGHTQPVKTVAWLARDTFVSGGQDQVVNMFRWCEQTNSVEMLNCCRGHERSVECVGVAPGGGAGSGPNPFSQLKCPTRIMGGYGVPGREVM